MKVCVIGGGSTYTPELVDGLLRRREQLDLHLVHLVDPDRDRLAVLGPLARRMAERAAAAGPQRAARPPVEVTWGDDRVAGIAGSGFVVSQIRVGGMAARERDEQLGREFGLIGQETVGVGGLANAWRTIPVALDIAADVARHAPGAVLLNFTNPAGLVTEALCRHGDVRSIGLCNVPWSMRARIAASLGVDVGAVTFDYVGLNHLSWARRVLVERNGSLQDRTDEVLARLGRRVQSAGPDGEPSWTPESIRLVGAVPNDYLLYFYETDAWLAHQAASPTRASRVRDIEAALLERYADPGLDQAPPELAARGGAHYSEAAAALMADLATDAGSVHVVNTSNRGAIPGLPDDVVVEVSARIGAAGPDPIPVAPLRPDVDALVRTVKDVELLAVEAAVTGDHDTAVRALATHPLGPSLTRAPALWTRLREVNAGLLGRLG